MTRLIDADVIPWDKAAHVEGFQTVKKMAVDNMPTVDAIVKDDNFGFAGYISKKDETGYHVEESWNLELNDEELMCIMCGVIQDLKKHKRLNKLWRKAVDLADFIGDES